MSGRGLPDGSGADWGSAGALRDLPPAGPPPAAESGIASV